MKDAILVQRAEFRWETPVHALLLITSSKREQEISSGSTREDGRADDTDEDLPRREDCSRVHQ